MIVQKFLDVNPDSVILIEGIEYLLSFNTFFEIMRFIYRVNDLVAHDDKCVLLISLNPEALDRKEMFTFVRELHILEEGSDQKDLA